MSNSASTSTSNSNTNSNHPNSTVTSADVSRPLSPYGNPIIHQQNLMEVQTHPETSSSVSSRTEANGFLSSHRQTDIATFNNDSRPSTPTVVYIVTSAFSSQTTPDGIRISESDVVGFQILAVFAKVEEANSYAEHECEEIDAGVRSRRRRRAVQEHSSDTREGAGIRAEAVTRADGTISWSVEGIGQIEVEQWVVQ